MDKMTTKPTGATKAQTVGAFLAYAFVTLLVLLDRSLTWWVFWKDKPSVGNTLLKPTEKESLSARLALYVITGLVYFVLYIFVFADYGI